MTETVLVAGTASHVGKSTIVSGLCRLLAREGRAVAPFKAQNMSNNARVALTPDGDWGEIGVSQYVQCQAAGIAPTTDVNPVLLKPRGEGESQLVIHGRAVGHFSARSYYEDHWEEARKGAIASFNRLADQFDVIIAEGAGSIAEINLHDRDLANVETGDFADARILLVVDIERGGAFAALCGTVELMPERLRERVAGATINKFRGDEALLEPGIEDFETRTGIPIVGVLPFDDPGLPAEDSVSLPDSNSAKVFGADDGVASEQAVMIAVPRLPRISNFTDLEPLANTPGVRVVYVPIDADVHEYDAVVIPGSKNTVDDLVALKETGFDRALRTYDGPIVGICGGYQMLGERVTHAHVESTDDLDRVDGVGLLPTETRFSTEKHVERVTRTISGCGPLAGASGEVTGYEIHMGETQVIGTADRPVGPASCAREHVFGTYLHGIFENDNARTAFVKSVFAHAGGRPPEGHAGDLCPLDEAADLVAEHVDLEAIGLHGNAP